MEQITGSVKAIYTELEGLRTKGESEQATNPREKENQITKLTSDLEKAQAARDRWETKAISSTQEIEQLRQEIKEHGKWRPVNSEQLREFFPTVTLRDGESEDAFLDSIRRQRRLMQRLNAEGYSIVCPVE